MYSLISVGVFNFVSENPTSDLLCFKHNQLEDPRIAYDEDRCHDIHALLLCSMICFTSCI